MNINGLNWFVIALGGSLGSVARALIYKYLKFSGFPWATFTVNVIGSFVIGAAYFLIVERFLLVKIDNEITRVFFITGFLGAFTTFSTFSLDTFLLLNQGYIMRALAYIISSVILCLLMTWCGYKIAGLLTT